MSIFFATYLIIFYKILLWLKHMRNIFLGRQEYKVLARLNIIVTFRYYNMGEMRTEMTH
jgi:hypothetical protein